MHPVLDAGKLLVYDPANQVRPRFTLVIQKDMAPLCDERALPLSSIIEMRIGLTAMSWMVCCRKTYGTAAG